MPLSIRISRFLQGKIQQRENTKITAVAFILNVTKLGTRLIQSLLSQAHTDAGKGTQDASCTLVTQSIQVHTARSNQTTAWDVNPFIRAIWIYPVSLSSVHLLSSVSLADANAVYRLWKERKSLSIEWDLIPSASEWPDTQQIAHKPFISAGFSEMIRAVCAPWSSITSHHCTGSNLHHAQTEPAHTLLFCCGAHYWILDEPITSIEESIRIINLSIQDIRAEVESTWRSTFTDSLP